MKKYLLISLLGITFFNRVFASDLDTSGGSHEEIILRAKDLNSLKSAKWVLNSDISDEQWDDLPTKAFMLDISKKDTSKASSISKYGLEKMSTMKINTLDLSNLQLIDENLNFLPKELKKLFLKNTSIKGCDLKYLPLTIEEIDLSNNKLSYKDLKKIKENSNSYDKIKKINLSDNILTGKVFEILPKNIETLTIERASNLSGFFPALLVYQNIKELHLAGTWLCSEDLKDINSILNLKILDISLCKISEEKIKTNITKTDLQVILNREAKEIYGLDGVSG